MSIYEISTEIRDSMNDYFSPDERELTRQLLSQTSQNRHFLCYQVTQQQEARIGADWLWVIFTNSGATPLLLQAKKLKKNEEYISKVAIGYKSSRGQRQIDILLQQSYNTGIPALYVLFSNYIDSFQCGNDYLRTREGVLIDSAKNLYDYLIGAVNNPVKHVPISCMFACFSMKCHYRDDGEDEILGGSNKLICNNCKEFKPVSCANSIISDCSECIDPIGKFLARQFGIYQSTVPMSVKLLPLVIAHSELIKKPDYVIDTIKDYFGEIELIPSNVIITDYMDKHGENYLPNMMGPGFEHDNTVIYSTKQIISVLKRLITKYPLFTRIGLFGSYAREEADSESDIDIALVYRKQVFDKKKNLSLLCDFIREVFLTFRKNVDFVDYIGAKKIERNKDFISDINEDLIWIIPSRSYSKNPKRG